MSAAAPLLPVEMGVQYYRAPTPPPDEWEDDLRRIRELGFDFIQIRSQWRWHEKRKGEYAWSDTDRLMDLAQENGLKVAFKSVVETAPDYVFGEYGAFRYDTRGNPVPPAHSGGYYIGGWEPCYNHPKVREAAELFLSEIVRRYKDHPALSLWNAWNEPRARPRWECCCRHCLPRFAAFLKERFGTIDTLNERFRTAFGSFEDVAPGTFHRQKYNLFLFTLYRAWEVKERVGWVAGILRRDETHPVISHVGMCSLVQDVLADTSYDPLTAQAVDAYGSSLPHWDGEFHAYDQLEGEVVFSNPRWRDSYYVIPMIPDWMRSVSPSFRINELYVNTWHYSNPDITPENLRLWVWSSLMRGSRGIQYWCFKSERYQEETSNMGFRSPAGKEDARTLEAARINGEVKRLRNLLDDFTPDPAPVLVVYDFESDIEGRLEDVTADNLNANVVGYRYKAAVKGAYGVFRQSGIRTDIVDSVNLSGRLAARKVLILPAFYRAEPDLAPALREFVEQGGTAIATLDLSYRDTGLFKRPEVPHEDFQSIFGVRQLHPKKAEGAYLRHGGLSLPAGRLAAVLEPLGADYRPLVTDASGRSFGFERAIGGGRAVYLGFDPFIAWHDAREPALVEFVRTLLPDDVTTLVDSWARMDAVSGESEGRKVLFVLNLEAVPADLAVNLPGEWQVLEGDCRRLNIPGRFELSAFGRAVLERK